MISAGPGPLIGRVPAQKLARRELAQLARLPLWERLLNDLGHLLGGTGNAIPRGWFGLIVFAILAVALIVVVMAWTKPRAERQRRGSGVLGGKARTAREYRAEAERLAGAGDYSRAIIEGVRAIAAELEERGILLARPGRTANEVAAEAGAARPGLKGDLGAAMRLFDDVRYGDRPGTATGYDLVSRVDAQVRSAGQAVARPADADQAEAGQEPGLAVPR
jgi:hypothetical protein